MLSPIKFFFSLFLLSGITQVYGQKIISYKEWAFIKGETIEGFAVQVDGKENRINQSFSRYLKNMGKVKTSDNISVVSEPLISGLTYTSPLYGLVRQNDTTFQAWIGIIPGEWSKADYEKVNRELQNLVYNFGIQYYRELVQDEIDETLRALQAVEKQQQRLINQNHDYQIKLEDNGRDKVRLEKALENNTKEKQDLKKMLEKNTKQQDSVAVSVQQVKRVLERQKEKQRSIQ